MISSDVIVTPVKLPATVAFERLTINASKSSPTEHFILQTVAEHQVVAIPELNIVLGSTTDSSDPTNVTVVFHGKLHILLIITF